MADDNYKARFNSVEVTGNATANSAEVDSLTIRGETVKFDPSTPVGDLKLEANQRQIITVKQALDLIHDESTSVLGSKCFYPEFIKTNSSNDNSGLWFTPAVLLLTAGYTNPTQVEEANDPSNGRRPKYYIDMVGIADGKTLSVFGAGTINITDAEDGYIKNLSGVGNITNYTNTGTITNMTGTRTITNLNGTLNISNNANGKVRIGGTGDDTTYIYFNNLSGTIPTNKVVPALTNNGTITTYSGSGSISVYTNTGTITEMTGERTITNLGTSSSAIGTINILNNANGKIRLYGTTDSDAKIYFSGTGGTIPSAKSIDGITLKAANNSLLTTLSSLDLESFSKIDTLILTTDSLIKLLYFKNGGIISELNGEGTISKLGGTNASGTLTITNNQYGTINVWNAGNDKGVKVVNHTVKVDGITVTDNNGDLITTSGSAGATTMTSVGTELGDNDYSGVSVSAHGNVTTGTGWISNDSTDSTSVTKYINSVVITSGNTFGVSGAGEVHTDANLGEFFTSSSDTITTYSGRGGITNYTNTGTINLMTGERNITNLGNSDTSGTINISTYSNGKVRFGGSSNNVADFYYEGSSTTLNVPYSKTLNTITVAGNNNSYVGGLISNLNLYAGNANYRGGRISNLNMYAYSQIAVLTADTNSHIDSLNGTATITTLGISGGSGTLNITNNGYNSTYKGILNISDNTYGTVNIWGTSGDKTVQVIGRQVIVDGVEVTARNGSGTPTGDLQTTTRTVSTTIHASDSETVKFTSSAAEFYPVFEAGAGISTGTGWITSGEESTTGVFKISEIHTGHGAGQSISALDVYHPGLSSILNVNVIPYRNSGKFAYWDDTENKLKTANVGAGASITHGSVTNIKLWAFNATYSNNNWSYDTSNNKYATIEVLTHGTGTTGSQTHDISINSGTLNPTGDFLSLCKNININAYSNNVNITNHAEYLNATGVRNATLNSSPEHLTLKAGTGTLILGDSSSNSAVYIYTLNMIGGNSSTINIYMDANTANRNHSVYVDMSKGTGTKTLTLKTTTSSTDNWVITKTSTGIEFS